ncbi:hypothetical protein CEXT_309961 [Caerostris extrusa]|uniref:Secreted protein n=1 Tax=Caerostris extrusa TaxID=172846 RepID=A0AAV4P6H2_CAEEX|nr:hypothetical protein CEXT_309961 [Caerostris extrusa]
MAMTMMQVRAGKSRFLLSAALTPFRCIDRPRKMKLNTPPGIAEVAIRWPREWFILTRGVKMPPSKRKKITEKKHLSLATLLCVFRNGHL